MGIVQLAIGDSDTRSAFAHLVMSGEADHAELADLELMAFALTGSHPDERGWSNRSAQTPDRPRLRYRSK